MPTPQQVGGLAHRVGDARRRLGVMEGRDIPPAELARMIGVAVSTITRLEAGERQPGEDLVQKIATALKVSPAWLRYGVEEPGVAPSGAPVVNQPPGKDELFVDVPHPSKRSTAGQGEKKKRRQA